MSTEVMPGPMCIARDRENRIQAAYLANSFGAFTFQTVCGREIQHPLTEFDGPRGEPVYKDSVTALAAMFGPNAPVSLCPACGVKVIEAVKLVLAVQEARAALR